MKWLYETHESSFIFVEKSAWLNAKVLCKTACKVFRIIKSYFVSYFGNVERMNFAVSDNNFARNIQAVNTYKPTGGLPSEGFQFFM